MTRTICNRLALAFLSLTVVSFAGSASAQTTGDRTGTGAGTDTGMAATRAETHDSGFNPGWLGLLGLLGLAGLMPKKAHVAATHRTGDTSAR